MSVLVVYESRRGRARRAAEAVAEAAATRGVATLLRGMDEVDPAHLAAAQGVIAGCWTPGDVPFGGQPTQRMAAWIDDLMPLEGKPVGVFCTYTFFPHTFADTAARTAETLNELGRRFELKGAKVAGTRSIHARSLDDGAAELVDELLDHLHDG